MTSSRLESSTCAPPRGSLSTGGQAQLDPEGLAVRDRAHLGGVAVEGEEAPPARSGGRCPCPSAPGASGSRGFRMEIRSSGPRRSASMRISPPSSIWAIPWVTAFSTRGWRRSGGTTQARAASSATTAWERRSPKRTFSMPRSCSARSSSSARGIVSREPTVRLRRRKSARRTQSCRASSGRAAMRALMELRLLKRKCGWICARRARSSASRDAISNSRARRSACCEAPIARSR